MVALMAGTLVCDMYMVGGWSLCTMTSFDVCQAGDVGM